MPGSRPVRLAASALLALTTAILPARAADPPLEFRKPRFTREQMESTLLAGGERWLFVYGTRDTAAAPALRARALLAARRMAGGDTTAVMSDRAARADLVAERSLILIGGPALNDWTAKLAAALPVQFAHGGFHWVDRDYARPGDVLNLVYPHPLSPAHFLVLVAGNSVAAMTRRGGGFMLGGDDWRIVRDGELARSGRFAQSAASPWRYDASLDHDREREHDAFVANLGRTPGRGVIVSAPRGMDATRELAGAEAVIRTLAAKGLALPPGAAPVSLVLYPSLEAKAVFTHVSRPEHVAADGVAHAALPAGHEAQDLWSVAGAVLQRSGASVDSRFLVPASVWLSGRYGGETLARAVSRIYYGRLLPSAPEAASVDSLWRSPLVWVPARALLARSVFEAAGAGGRPALAKLLARDPSGEYATLCRAVGADPKRVERRYLDLADSLARVGSREPPVHVPPRAWHPSDGFMRGVCFAHAVSLERGYLSAAAGRELAALQKMGANWISLTPFGYLPGLDVPEIYPSAQGGPEEENDESVCEAAARARALGIRVWLKPHLWTRGWVGEMDFGPSGWPRFFAQYRRLVLHYALLAEREGMDGFVVGHELPTASLRFPERWRALIGEVRRVYSGTITYGANWDREVDQVAFWDAVDVIGVSFYGPLAEHPTRDVGLLTKGARRALARLRAVSVQTGKPVVLLEAGYAANAMAPVKPWEETDGAPDMETQRACYEALVRALDPEVWVGGAFFWKWYSAPDVGGSQDGSFTPRGKPAEQVMARALREWNGRPVRAAVQ